MSIELVMPSIHLILCFPLLPSVFSMIRVFFTSEPPNLQVATALPMKHLIHVCGLARVQVLVVVFFFLISYLPATDTLCLISCPTFHSSGGWGIMEGVPGSCGFPSAPWA